jgi:Tfp pilus assembly protein PilF
MLNRRCQHIFWIAGFWLVVLTGLSPADEIQVKSKALAHYIMAVVHDLNGDSQQAMKDYEKSAKYDRKQALPHLRLAAYYVRVGRLSEATQRLKTVLKLHPNSYQAHYLLALIYSSQKKYDLAAYEYELILKGSMQENSDNIEVYAYLSQLYFALGKYPQALTQVEQVLQFQPQNVSALYLRGSAYVEVGEKEKSKEDFRKILSLEPGHDATLNSLAYIYAEEGTNLDEAVKMVRKAISIDPSNGAYYDTLGWVLFKQGFKAEALIALEKAQTYVTDPIIYEHMGDVYSSVSEPALARKFWLKALTLDPKLERISKKVDSLNRVSAKNQNSKVQSANK